MRIWRSVIALGIVAGAASVLAQAPDRLTFEVASVKENRDPGAKAAWDMQPGGRVAITAYTLLHLMAIAYDSPSIQTRDQIVGGPDWIKSDRFDVLAKAIGNIDNDETGRPTRLLAMLRSLLEERFKLQMHREHRQGDAFLLVLTTKDGKIGPQLHRSTQGDCAGTNANAELEQSPHWCGWRGFGTGHFTIQGQTMDDIARGLAGTWSAGRPIFDRTGLSGRWDAQLDFVPTFVSGPNPVGSPVQNPADNSGPDMFSALHDQLGLKLESGKADLEYLVIDHVEHPTGD